MLKTSPGTSGLWFFCKSWWFGTPFHHDTAKINCLPEITSNPQTNYLRNVETEGGTKEIVSIRPVLTGRKGAYLCDRFHGDTTQCFHRGSGRFQEVWNASHVKREIVTPHFSSPQKCKYSNLDGLCKDSNSLGKGSKSCSCIGGKKEFRRICHFLYHFPPQAAKD